MKVKEGLDERWRTKVHPAKGRRRSRGRIKSSQKFFLEITPMSLMGPEKKKKDDGERRRVKRRMKGGKRDWTA